MRIELTRSDVETILKKYMDMDTIVLNDDGSATLDTTLEKIVSNTKSYTAFDPETNQIYIEGTPNKIKHFLDKVNKK